MITLLERRYNMMSLGGVPPYDAQVEYIESTGTQYIDTGIIGTHDIDYDIDFINTTSSTRYAQDVFGSQSSNTSNRYSLQLYLSGSTRKLYFSSNSTKEINLTSAQLLQRHTAKKIGNSFYFDGTSKATIKSTTYATPTTILLFAKYREEQTEDKIRNFFTGKVYYFKLGNRDFIPVRVGQVGYMYDKVSKQLFGNNGTGDFIVGPDVTT